MSIENRSAIAGVVKKATSWLHPSRHYETFEQEAKSLSDTELLAKRHKYDHVKRNTVAITALGVGAAAGGVLVLGPNLPREALLLSPGPLNIGVCFMGPTRGIIRESERNILDEVIERRGLKSQKTVVYQSKV